MTDTILVRPRDVRLVFDKRFGGIGQTYVEIRTGIGVSVILDSRDVQNIVRVAESMDWSVREKYILPDDLLEALGGKDVSFRWKASSEATGTVFEVEAGRVADLAFISVGGYHFDSMRYVYPLKIVFPASILRSIYTTPIVNTTNV